jgi:serine/threonine-protein kinase HipA
MNTAINIRLWGQDVAAMVWSEEQEFATLEFYETFAKTGIDISPLMMPLSDIFRGERLYSFPALRGKTFNGLPGLIADSLPDDYGNSIIDEWFASRRTTVSVTPLDRLCYIGKRGMGALEFEPANSDELLNESSRIEIEQLTTLAKDVLNRRESFQENLRSNNKTVIDILKIGTSAGGAKPKAIIAFDEKTGEVRSGQVKAPDGFTYWLLKFDGLETYKLRDNPPGIGRIEYAYHKMAVDCGIRMTECCLLKDGKNAHFMTKRFDRTDSGEKLHTQTLCGIAHFDRDNRYSYEQLFQTMRRLQLPYPDMEQMFRRMVFNVVARNHDDHTKNHSFIMDKSGNWRLASAYDLCYSYSPSSKWTSVHQLSLNGKRDNFTREDLNEIAEKMDIKKGKEIIRQIVDVVSHWKNYANEAEVKTAFADQIFENLILFFTK